MAKRDFQTSMQSKLTRLQSDMKYEFLRPLLAHLEPLVNQPKDERDREYAKGLFAAIQQLQAKLEQGGNVHTHIENMFGGNVLPGWIVLGGTS